VPPEPNSAAYALLLCGILQTVSAQLAIDVNQRLVVHTFSGVLTDADIAGLPARVRSHPDFDPTFSELLDFSGVTAGTISTSALDAVARSKSSFSRASLHVLIAPQDHIFGLARMAQVFAGETRPNSAVVRTMEEAREILALGKTGKTGARPEQDR
jgi:hypothetical protein